MEPKQKQVCWWVPLVKKSIKVLKIIHDLGPLEMAKDQIIVCVQIHRQTSKADLLKSRGKNAVSCNRLVVHLGQKVSSCLETWLEKWALMFFEPKKYVSKLNKYVLHSREWCMRNESRRRVTSFREYFWLWLNWSHLSLTWQGYGHPHSFNLIYIFPSYLR